MTTTANFTIPAEPLGSLQVLRDKRHAAAWSRRLSRSKAETEPKDRLWKLCAEAASPRLSVFEWFGFLLLGVLPLGDLVCGFSELFHLFNTGALDTDYAGENIREYVQKTHTSLLHYSISIIHHLRSEFSGCLEGRSPERCPLNHLVF